MPRSENQKPSLDFSHFLTVLTKKDDHKIQRKTITQNNKILDLCCRNVKFIVFYNRSSEALVIANGPHPGDAEGPRLQVVRGEENVDVDGVIGNKRLYCISKRFSI